VKTRPGTCARRSASGRYRRWKQRPPHPRIIDFLCWWSGNVRVPVVGGQLPCAPAATLITSARSLPNMVRAPMAVPQPRGEIPKVGRPSRKSIPLRAITLNSRGKYSRSYWLRCLCNTPANSGISARSNRSACGRPEAPRSPGFLHQRRIPEVVLELAIDPRVCIGAEGSLRARLVAVDRSDQSYVASRYRSCCSTPANYTDSPLRGW
jgi:hypothetical protein